MYYHVLIETLEENNAKKQYSDFDKTDLEEIKEEYIIPFVKKQTLQINGYFIESGIIKRFQIKKTDRDLESYIQVEQRKLMSNSIIMPISKLDIFSNKCYSIDITKQLLKEISGILNMDKIDNTKVFIVHGHDDAIKLEVARFIEHLGLTAIILNEKPNEGRTIIEKIEKYSDVGYAIILYTPCDKGGEFNGELEDYKPRARQNVVFEHGYFIGKLGRERVYALVKGDIEKPNDISGVVYTPMDGNWKLDLCSNLSNSGFNIDMNKVIKKD